MVFRQYLAITSALVVTSFADPCPTCYTRTVPGWINCPLIPALTTPCYEAQCVVLTTTFIPGSNRACPTTPTFTTYAACPKTATCRKGCLVLTTTKTGTSYDCEVSWETGTPSSETGVILETAATNFAYLSGDKHNESTTKAPSSTVTGQDCIPPPCYTHTIPTLLSCPSLAPPHPLCVQPACAILTTSTIPGPNPACPTTPTVVITEACPTTSTCRKGCLVITSTVTAPSWSCASATSEASSAADTWCKRDAELMPQIELGQPRVSISWGKEKREPEVTAIPELNPQIWRGRPKVSINRGKDKRPPKSTPAVALADMNVKREVECVVTSTLTIVPPCVPFVCLPDEFLCPVPMYETSSENIYLEVLKVCSTSIVTSYARCPTCGTDCATTSSSSYAAVTTKSHCQRLRLQSSQTITASYA